MKKKNILVTGGTGFLGRAIVNRLATNHNVIIFDNDSRGSITKINNNKNINYICGDIRVFNDLLKLKKYKISEIYHLAYINGTETFYKKPMEILDVAILGILNVLKLAEVFKIKKILLASSSEVYQTPTSIPTDVDERLIVPDIQNPRYSYGLGKIFAEFYSYHFSKKKNLSIKIFIPHNMFGPDMGNEHVIPQLLKRIFQKKNNNKKLIKLKIQGSGNETRSFCFIDDAVNQILAINKYGKRNQIYNVGQNREMTIKKLIEFIGKIINKKIILRPSKVTLGSTKRRCPKMTKTFRLIKNKNNFDIGLKKTVEWYAKEYTS